jgi:DNA-binding NarL/FixJ family response regulator
MEPLRLLEPSREHFPANPIRVLIFDSTKMGCQLLGHMLEGSSYNVQVVGASTQANLDNGSQLPEADVALISVNAGDGPSTRFKLLREIRQAHPNIRCIMLLDRCDREHVVESFSSGVMGICGRDESCEVLCKCIDRVHQGQVWANSEQLHFVLDTFCAGNRIRFTDARGDALLTQREETIVYLVAEGLRNREIAAQLKLSEHTVRNYLFRIFEKLGISSRSELILYTLEQRRKGVVGQQSPS